jgi:hypothetical protein
VVELAQQVATDWTASVASVGRLGFAVAQLGYDLGLVGQAKRLLRESEEDTGRRVRRSSRPAVVALQQKAERRIKSQRCQH